MLRLHDFCIVILLFVTMNTQAKDEFIVGMTEQGLRTATVEEIELGFNSQLAQLSRNNSFSFKLKIFESDQMLVKALHQKKLQVYFGSPIMLFNHLDEFDLEHIYTPVLSGKVKQQYLILVKKGSHINQLEQLRNKTIAHTQSDHVGIEYLSQVLETEKLGNSKTFFKKLELEQNPNLVAMSVFFNKADAGIMLESDFDIAAELNPQLRAQLTILKRSPAYVTNILAFVNEPHKDTHDRRMQFVINSVRKVSKKIKLSNAYGFSQMQVISFKDLETVHLLVKDSLAVKR